MQIKHLIMDLIKFDPEDEVYVSNINADDDVTTDAPIGDMIVQVIKDDEDANDVRLEYNGPAISAENLAETG